MRYIKAGILILFCSVFLAGCGGSKSLSLSKCADTTIFIHKDGTVEQVIVEPFEESYYDAEELEDFITAQVDFYNSQNENHEIKASSLKKKGSEMKIRLTYDSLISFAAFNSVTADSFDMAKAAEVEIIPDTFVSVSDSSTVDSSEITEKGDKYKVLYINETCSIQMEGKMKYYSGAVVLNNTTLQTSAGEPAVIVYE